MAQISREGQCEFQLPLLLAPKDITETGLRDVAKDLKDDIHLLQNYIASSKDLAFVHITDVTFETGCIYLKFKSDDERGLLDFYRCTQDLDNRLSRTLTNYFEEQSLHFQAGLQISSKVVCTIRMSKKECLTYQLTFFSDESGNRGEADSNKLKSNKTGTEQKPEIKNKTNGKEKQTNVGLLKLDTDEKMETQTDKPKGKTDGKGQQPGASLQGTHTDEKGETQIGKPEIFEKDKTDDKGENPSVELHEIHTDEKRETKTGKPEKPYVDKIFLLFVPNQTSAKVKHLTIEFKGCHALNHEFMPHGKYLNEFKVRIPAGVKETCQYRYSVVWKGLFSRETVEKSKYFTLNENIFQRDIWIDSKKIPYIDDIGNGVSAHLLDILFHDSCNIDLYDSCTQIEQVCKEELPNEKAMSVISFLKRKIYETDPPNIRLLFLVAAGKILQRPDQIFSEKILDQASAQRMINAAEDYCLDNIPPSCRSSTQLIYFHVCKIIATENKCLINYINIGFAFFDDSFILEQVLECIKSKIPISSDNEKNLSIVSALCSKLYHKAVTQNTEVAGQVIETLLRNMPMRCSVSAFAALQKPKNETPENELTVQNQIYGSIGVRIDAFLTEIEKNKSVRHLVFGWRNIIDIKGIDAQMLAPKFEDALIFILESRSIQNDPIPEMISRCIEKYGLFQEERKRKTLLEVIAKSQRTEVLNTFFLLSESSMTAIVYSSLSEESIINLCHNLVACGARVCNSRDEEVRYVCTRLSKVWSIPQIQARTECVQILKLFMFREFEKCRPEDLLTKIEFMEKLASNNGHIAEVFKDYYTSLIEGNSDKTAEEILNWFPKTGGERRVDSRLMAELVCVFLKVQEGTEETTSLEYFLRLVSQYKIWLTIISMKGKHIDIVKYHRSFNKVIDCIGEIVQLFRTHRVKCDFVECLERNPTDAKAAKMLLAQQCTETEIKKFWQEALMKFKEVKEDLIRVDKVLSKVAEVTKGRLPIFEKLIDRVKDTQHALSSGKYTTKECISNDLIWKGIDKLPQICAYLEPLINSKVFWNVCLENVETEFNFEVSKRVLDDDPLDSLSSLFQNISISHSFTPTIDHNSHCVLYMSVLHEKGCQLYGDIWKALFTEDRFPIQKLLLVFGKSPDINTELEIARGTLHIVIEDSDEKTLKRIFSIDEVEKTVGAIEAVAKVFNIDQINDPKLSSAIEAFRKLINGTTADYSFREVKVSLNTVYSLAENLSEETVHIMISLGNSSTLVEFLKCIVDEDIKNLIDAVEDISEQQVTESTVSALIEVKQYLHPLLLSQGGRDCAGILHTLQKQTNALTKHAGSFPQKIQDCVLNLHNLKSLYNGVANRGEQTKEMIKNIVSRGSFQFSLNQIYTDVDFEVTYKQNRNKETHKKSTLIDLRSRALLLMNTERTNPADTRFKRDELLRFIESVDLCLDISETLFALHMSGHMEYWTIKEHIRPKELLPNKETFSLKFRSWLHDVNNERRGHYLMNFVQGNQLHTLYKYLEQSHEDVNVVQTILSFIHPNLQAPLLKKLYQEEKAKFMDLSNEVMLHCIGHTLHSSLNDLDNFYRLISDQKIKTLSGIVQPGKLSVIQLDEGSLHTVRTLLALFMNTTQRLPEPNHVLFCTRETSFMELELLIHRCMGANDFHGIKTLFCIANVEILPNEIQFSLVEILRHLDKETKFLLAIICRGSRNHPFIDELNDCVTSVTPVTEKTVRDIFKVHCRDVVTVTSDMPGLGKTSYIKKIAHQRQKAIVTLHISGSIRKGNLVERINDLRVKQFHVLHIDVGNVDDPSELDTFLFELVVLRYVSAGRMSVCLQVLDVFIEISNTINDTLKNSLQTAVLFQRENLNWKGIDDLIISKENNSPVQIVCRYLKELDRHTLDTKDIRFTCELQRPLSSTKCKTLLKKYVPDEVDSSFPILYCFIHVLADQLKKMSESSFFKINYLKDMMGEKIELSVKTQLVQAMISACSDFATRSIDVCRKGQLSTVGIDIDEQNQRFETSLQCSNFAVSVAERVEGMVRWEESNHLMFVFHNQNIHTLSALYRHLRKVPVDIRSLFESQIKKPMEDFRQMDQRNLQNILQKIARVNPMSLPAETITEMSETYALTADNLLKMVLIILRIKAHIPVIVMGETGCGKTSLTRYLAAICEVEFDVMNIHAGVLEEEIIKTVLKNNDQALKDIDNEMWLFLDEINTSESIGLIADIICHHKCLGKELSPNLVIMGACNPYKLRTTEAIYTAGLEGKAKTDQLSRLVYRVLPLPEMVVDFVWDFGSLSENDEREYIHRMIADVFSPENSELHELFTTLLSVSQDFVRKIQVSTYSVSLRDVQRCKLLTKWFLKFLPKKTLTDKTSQTLCDLRVKSMILALAHCYQSRFYDKNDRRNYRSVIGKAFSARGYKFNVGQENFIQDVIKEEQADILRRMKLPPGTACNTALQENVFVILVCIFNRIPIFVVGKPGCSKSLAMQLIKSNLRGKDSEDVFFRELPQLYCVSFQGSESSTSDGIIKVFAKAKKYQDSNSPDEVMSVVILDEIGLAEISRFNPLKVLHNLLEPDGHSQPDVAVVGISNWALDASKMNRAVHLSRPDMDEEELFDTAISISQSFLGKEQKSTLFQTADTEDTSASTLDIRDELQGMAKAYYQYIIQLRFKHFHGLRDYYSLIKFVARTFAEHGYTDSKEVIAAMIMNGIARNFGGLPDELQTLYDVFRQHIPFVRLKQKPLMDLITENIQDPIARHLMVITTGESVLGIIEQKLKTIGCDRKEIIFGSQFEEDLTEDYNYRILSRIILCMEEGMVLILKDLDSIYGSLYDMLNQNYTVIGKKKNCRVALGPYSNPICHVAETFRCIVLIDEGRLDLTDPPFLNRFEKQYLRFFDIIQENHYSVIRRLEDWIDDLANTGKGQLKKEELFAMYNNDLMASLVLKTEDDITQRRKSSFTNEDILAECKGMLLKIMKPEIVIREKMANGQKERSLPDEMVRQYFSFPIHNGLECYILHQIESLSQEELHEGLLNIVFTNSNVHAKSTKVLSQFLSQVEKLGTFKSEKQLSSRIQYFWNNCENNILVVQCSAKDDGRHILLTKLVIERCRNAYKKKNVSCPKHVYFVIHLNRSKTSPSSVSQLNFLSEWKLVMIDSIECPSIPLPKLHKLTLHEAILAQRPLKSYLQEELFWAFSRICYGTHGRDVSSISEAIANIERSTDFLVILENEILSYVQKESSSRCGKSWQLDVACDYTALTSSSSFVNALDIYIMDTIKTPLAKLIYRIEQTGILNSFFTCQHDASVSLDVGSRSKRTAWISGIHDDRLFLIDEVPDETGPECYTCQTVDYSLIMPFSLYIYENIEATKEEFMETVQNYRTQCLLADDDDLPSIVYNEVLLQHEKQILRKVPDLNALTYETWESDYIGDFCNISEHMMLLNVVNMGKTKILKLILERFGFPSISDPFGFILRLHTMVWVNFDSIRSELLLIGKCLSIMPESEDEIMGVFKTVNRTSVSQCLKNALQEQNIRSETLSSEKSNLRDPLSPNYTEKEDTLGDNMQCFIDKKDEFSGISGISENISRNVQGDECKFSLDLELSAKNTSTDADLLSAKNLKQDNSRDEAFENREIYTNSSWSSGEAYKENKSESPTEERNILVSWVDDNAVPEFSERDTGTSISQEVGNCETSFRQADALFGEISSTIGHDICRFDESNENRDEIMPGFAQEVESMQNTADGFSLNDSKNNLSISDLLVHTVCMHMLPTSHFLKQHSSIHKWLNNVSSIISIAAKVSRSPSLLYSLRVCIELVTDLIIPLALNVSLIETLGDALGKGFPLDSKQVFSAILDIIESALIANVSYGEDIDTLCHRTLSSYFVRCLSADPDTLAFHYLFILLLESRIPEQSMKLYKVPVSLFLQSIDEEFFTDILFKDLLNGENENRQNTEEHVRNISMDTRGRTFLFKLDGVLKQLLNDSKQGHTFIILLADILQDIYANELPEFNYVCDAAKDIDSAFEQNAVTLFYKCHKTLQEHLFGLKYVASISFCKCFIVRAANRVEVADEGVCSKILSILDVALTDQPVKKRHRLTEVFLKELVSSRTISQLQGFCIKQGEKYSFLTNFDWEERNSVRVFDKSPLCLHVGEMCLDDGCFCCMNMDIKQFNKHVVEIVRNANTSVNSVMQMLSFVLSQFYLQLTESDFDDARRTEAGLLYNEIVGAKFSTELETLAKCMLGEENFSVTRFMLTNSTPLLHVSEVSLLASFYILLLSHNEFFVEGGKLQPVLVRCLIKPKSIDGQFLPGWTNLDEENDDSRQKPYSGANIYLETCRCGCRNAFVGLQGMYVCAICKSQVSVAKPDLENKVPLFIERSPELPNITSSNNNKLNPVTKHLLQFLVNGCLLGSIALGFSSENVISDILSVQSNEAAQLLTDSLDTHWNAMKVHLNLDDNKLRTLIHAIFLKAEKHLCSNTTSCKTYQEKTRWENAFEEEILPVINNRFQTIQKLLRQYTRLHNDADETINKRLLETDDINSPPRNDEIEVLPTLYRIRSIPNKPSFVFELYALQEEFPLLQEIICNEDLLKLPVHILSIIQWHNATVANASYMLKRHDCLKMTVQDFIYFKEESMKKNVMKTRFEEFRKSWDVLLSSIKSTEVSQHMTRIHYGSTMSDCLILGDESVPFKVLKTLIKIQNGFLDNILKLANKCKGLMMLERDGAFIIPCAKANEVKKDELLTCTIDWDSLLMQESQCDLNYGCGKYIHYDFYRIEESVAHKVISGKAYIISEDTLPSLVFVDELHRNYSSLIKELRMNVRQQTLPLDVSSGIISRKEEDPRMSTELLNHLGIVMTVLKKTEGDPDQPLVDYVDSWQSIMCRNFPKHLLPSPESNIKLCHIVAVSELLEELSADSVKEGLGDEYRHKIDEPMQDHVLQQLKDEKLSLIVVNALKRFIYRCLASKTADPKQTIRIYLSDESFWPMDMCRHEGLVVDGNTVQLKNVLPDGLMVCHIHDLLSLMEKEIERRRQGNIKLSGFVSSFHARSKTTLETKSTQRKKKIVAARMF